MRYELLIGWRYLRAKRKEGFISMITGISMLGLIIGVITLNVVLAVFTGFEEDLRDRILSFNPQVVVLSFNGMIRDPRGVVERIEHLPDVVAAAPFIYGQVLLTAQQKVIGAVVRAVGPESEKVIDLQRHLTAGTVGDLAGLHQLQVASGERVALPALIIGKELAQQLGVRVGDAVNVTAPLSAPSAIGVAPRIKRFVVVGLFDSGMQEYDASLVYMDLTAAQQFFELGAAVTGIEVRVADFERAPAVAARLGQTLGFPYRVRDWMEVNHNLFAALRVGKTVYSIVLLLIVVVAAFNVVSMLIMVVMEKRKDIAVLKSMGATRAGIGRIFIFKGMIIGVAGTAIGNLGAYILCELLKHYKFIELPKDVYAVDTLQVRMYPEYFLAVSAAALLLCLLATVYPARQAARLAPVDVIRYD
jgi:lipoprotein-releasing system permease protein